MAQLRDELSKTGEPLGRRKVEANQSQQGGVSHDSLLQLQRRAGNRAVTDLLVSSNAPGLQRAPKNGDAGPIAAPETAPPEHTATGPLIVEDDATNVGPGQMRKREFLEQLRSTVCSTTDAALKEAGQSTEGCPYIEQWLAYYTDQPPAHIERALRKYAPEAATAITASDYIPAVSNRVRQAVETWVSTGEITGVPDELAGMLSGPGAAMGAMAGILGGIGSAIGGAISAIGSAFSSIGQALFKRKEDQPNPDNESLQVQAKLTEGQPLDGGLKSRMGAAFGHDFSNVRVHTGSSAAALSDQLDARAFTIGSDIAFGSGEYQPGTMIGDALIAHELAHVVQQGGGSEVAPLHKGDTGTNESLEEDADLSAVGAILSTWNGLAGDVKDIGRNAMPRMRSGLRLQRCRRETNVTPEEADALIRGRFGANLTAAIAAKVTAVGRVRVVNDAQFAANYRRIGGPTADYTVVAAFVDRSTKPPTVYIHETRQHPATVVHEALHLYSSNTMRASVPDDVKEGMTEYFTRQIVEQENIKEREHYEDEYKCVAELAELVGEKAMREAYFEGKVKELETAVDAARSERTFHNWSVSMDAGDWDGAHSALKPEK